MKKVLILTLVGLNAVLLAALLFGTALSPAHAQVIGGGTDYLMLPVMMHVESDGVIIIDLAKQKMAAIRLDTKTQRAVAFRMGRQLSSDFGTGQSPGDGR